MSAATIVRLSDYRLAAGAEGQSYPHDVAQLEEETEEEKQEEVMPSSVAYAPPETDKQRTSRQVEEMRQRLLEWHVWNARRVLALHDPVAVAWAITDTEDAIAAGGVNNPGGLFLWLLKQQAPAE